MVAAAEIERSARVADMVCAIGTPAFAERFLGALQALSGSQFCSAFAIEDAAAPRVLFAQGGHPSIPAFAQSASLAYSREFWRADRSAPWVGARPGGERILRTASQAIRDPRHRRFCYERAGIGERLSVFRAGKPAILASGYRAVSEGGYSGADIERVELNAPILLSAIARHRELTERSGQHSRDDIVQMLMGAKMGLSGREAEVAAGLIHGRTQAEIGEEAGVSLSSVITYRRRAYQKLGVGNRRRLLQFYRELNGA